jgi:hypothetical protein
MQNRMKKPATFFSTPKNLREEPGDALSEMRLYFF